MQRSTDRIYTTHVGSLARPVALLDLMKASAAGQPGGDAELTGAHRGGVADIVARQRAAGIDVINDGEQGKTGFFAYIGQRLGGDEARARRNNTGKIPPGVGGGRGAAPAATRRTSSGRRSTTFPTITSSTSSAR